ncbi:MAG: hypothetical protein LBL13_01400 [Bacteroidales bacterium]|nr:hypothetical protein [Bacteroidales bacterium]
MGERKITLTCSLVYLFTDYTTLSSLRGTKQSRTMEQKRAYNDKGCMAIREGILDCFASLFVPSPLRPFAPPPFTPFVPLLH